MHTAHTLCNTTYGSISIYANVRHIVYATHRAMGVVFFQRSSMRRATTITSTKKTHRKCFNATTNECSILFRYYAIYFLNGKTTGRRCCQLWRTVLSRMHVCLYTVGIGHSIAPKAFTQYAYIGYIYEHEFEFEYVYII